jgi:hypothetical protein
MKKLTMAGLLLASFYSSLFLGASALGAVLYTDATSFGAHIQPSAYTETFNSLALGEHSPPSIGFTSGGFSYTVSSLNGLWVTSGVQNAPASDRFIGIEQSPGTLRIDFTSGNISAVGGYFVDLNDGNTASGNLTFTLSDGTVQTISNPTTATFTGFIASAPLSWMEINDQNLAGHEWPNMNDLTVGVSAVPEPGFIGAIAALGLVLVIGVTEIRSRRQLRV